MSTGPQIRPRRAEDLSPLTQALARVQITQKYPLGEYTSNGIKEFLTPPHMVQAWTAELNGQPVGQVTLNEAVGTDAFDSWVERGGDKGTPAVHLGRYFVSLDARGTGLGSGLVETACRWARDNGKIIVLTVIHKQNPVKAIRIYEQNGFKHVSEGFLNGQEEQHPASHYVAL